MHEFDLIKKYFSKLSKLNKSSLDLNDDVFFDKRKSLVISIDTYNEGVHFVDFKKPDLVIKKILRSSISDLICKGVLPKYYFISGSGNKKTFTHKNLGKEFNFNNLDKLFQVILKSATYELLYKPNISINIIIKEYLNASNFFLDNSQTKYLNALLDNIAKKIRLTNAWVWTYK